MEKKLSIVVPYRNREDHLNIFVPWMVKNLQDEEIPFHIFIINQGDLKGFNRAKLLNIGFKESESFDYFCFHDVDMLPVDSDYSFPKGPTHLATSAEQFGYKLPYDGYFGGVTLFDKNSFQKINGYSNDYWGWGAEDDDVLLRCRIMGVQTFRKSCRYKSLNHERKIESQPYNLNLYKLANFQRNPTPENVMADGLLNLKYEKVGTEQINQNCTKITVEL